MGKNNRQELQNGKSQAQAARQRMYTHMVVLLLTFTFIIGGPFGFSTERISALKRPYRQRPKRLSPPPRPRRDLTVSRAAGSARTAVTSWRSEKSMIPEKWRPHILIPPHQCFPGDSRTGRDNDQSVHRTAGHELSGFYLYPDV